MPEHVAEIQTEEIGLIQIFLRKNESDVVEVIPEEMLDSGQDHKDFEEYIRKWKEDKLKNYEKNKNLFEKMSDDERVKKFTVSREEYIKRVEEGAEELLKTFSMIRDFRETSLSDNLLSGVESLAQSKVEESKNKKERDSEVDRIIIKELGARVVDLELDKEELEVKMKEMIRKGDIREAQLKLWQEKGFFGLILQAFKKLFGKG